MVPAIFVLKYASNRHFAMILGWLVLGLIARFAWLLFPS